MKFRVLNHGWLYETAEGGTQSLVLNKRPPDTTAGGVRWCDELITRHPDNVSPYGDVTLGAPGFDSLVEALTPPAQDVYSVIDRALADLRRALGNMTYPRANGGTMTAAEVLDRHLKEVETFVAYDAKTRIPR